MNAVLKRLGSPAMIVACVALVVALGGVSYAAGVLPANSVGAKQIKQRAVTLKKLSPAARGALRGQKGATGPAGPKGDPGASGPAGPKGDKGDPGVSLYANVGAGALESGTALSAERLELGTYLVTFGRDVSHCAAVASPGLTTGGAATLIATGVTNVGDDSFANNQVEVQFHARDAQGIVEARDTDFHLIVAC
jgi:hypothetical protein